jgi:hypothetical protein
MQPNFVIIGKQELQLVQTSLVFANSKSEAQTAKAVNGSKISYKPTIEINVLSQQCPLTMHCETSPSQRET